MFLTDVASPPCSAQLFTRGCMLTRPDVLQEKSNSYNHRDVGPEATRRAREHVYDVNKKRNPQCGCDQ